jgi:hypothetical protein
MPLSHRLWMISDAVRQHDLPNHSECLLMVVEFLIQDDLEPFGDTVCLSITF